MSETITREDGSTIEVFTVEEIDAKQQEAIEQYKSENPDKSGELSELEEKLRVAEEKLGKADDKDKNFATLRKQKDEAEKKVADILAGVDEKITKAKTEVLEGVMKDHYNDTLQTLAGGDEELKKKIEFNFKRLGDVASTKAEITKKFQDAAKLAGVSDADAVNTSVFSSGGVGRLNIKGSETKFTAEEKELAAKFGLSGKDLGDKK